LDGLKGLQIQVVEKRIKLSQGANAFPRRCYGILKLAAVTRCCNRVAAKSIAFEGRANLIDAHPSIKGVVDVEGHQVADLSRSIDRLHHPDWRTVGVRSIAIDELAKHPEAGSEN
jgi:hypothetical protein